MQYLIQQTQEFHNRVDGVEKHLVDLQDKIAVSEYNIVRELRSIRRELSELYIEEEEDNANARTKEEG